MNESSRVDAAKARILLAHPLVLERWARDRGLPLAEARVLLQGVLAERASLEESPGPSKALGRPDGREGGSPVAPPPGEARERPPEGRRGAGGENAVLDRSAYYPTGGLVSQREGNPNDLQKPSNRDLKKHPPLGVSIVCRAVRDEKNPASGKRRLLGVLQALLRLLVPSRELRRKLIRAQGQVEFYLPSELVALHLGVPRSTLYGWIKALEEEGLLQTRPLKVRVGDRILNAGTLWALRLGRGRKARLSGEAFRQEWRDLAGDMDQGVLSYAWVKAREKVRPSLRVLGAWATGQRIMPGQEPEVDLNLIALLPLLQENPEEARTLPATITLLAQALAKLFNDHRSRRFYAGLLWKVARGELPAWWLLNAIRRLLEDFREGFVRKPGAVLQSWLREKGGERAA